MHGGAILKYGYHLAMAVAYAGLVGAALALVATSLGDLPVTLAVAAVPGAALMVPLAYWLNALPARRFDKAIRRSLKAGGYERHRRQWRTQDDGYRLSFAKVDDGDYAWFVEFHPPQRLPTPLRLQVVRARATVAASRFHSIGLDGATWVGLWPSEAADVLLRHPDLLLVSDGHRLILEESDLVKGAFSSADALAQKRDDVETLARSLAGVKGLDMPLPPARGPASALAPVVLAFGMVLVVATCLFFWNARTGTDAFWATWPYSPISAIGCLCAGAAGLSAVLAWRGHWPLDELTLDQARIPWAAFAIFFVVAAGSIWFEGPLLLRVRPGIQVSIDGEVLCSGMTQPPLAPEDLATLAALVADAQAPPERPAGEPVAHPFAVDLPGRGLSWSAHGHDVASLPLLAALAAMIVSEDCEIPP